MKILLALLSILSSISVVLADIPPIREENKPTNESTCLGFALFSLGIIVLAGWILKKRSVKANG